MLGVCEHITTAAFFLAFFEVVLAYESHPLVGGVLNWWSSHGTSKMSSAHDYTLA